MEDPTSVAATGMPTVYEPGQTEARWYRIWVERGYFHARADSGKEPFCIVLPPPNVTGALHMGHAFQQLLQDIVIRRKRMQGYEALWLPGTDHAGIATQVVVERELAMEGLDRRELGRSAFIERVWQWKEQYGGRIVEQMQALGNSCDWDRLRFTMDPGLAHAVRVAFVRLYEAGLIYRGERIINWCPKDTTALSDSEVEHDEVEGELVTFRYDLTDGTGHIDVATTRVETMLGDTGVAVHPRDERYASLVGKSVRHPFTDEDLPIVADPAVDRTFGTGAVKVTPAHDPTDFDIGQRHGLGLKNILTATAKISDAAPAEFRGLDRYEARHRVLERLREMGNVIAEVRPYPHAVGHCYRCHSEVEPWISGQQWFVAVEKLKGPAKQAALDGRIAFHPERWIHAYTQWLDGLRDWNISRQLWWGHQIPVWYCGRGHQFASVDDPIACPECGSGEIEQDPDVLDTWFSSQLWPFSTLGWPEQAEDLRFFYPTAALITGYEILYLWVARMIMSGLFLMGDVPFRDVVIHGLVRDPLGRKMSKSLGNVIDPLDTIERVGADALRFGLAWQATDAQNIPFGEEHIDAGRRFANKIWNASRMVLMARDGAGSPSLPPESSWTLPDRWLLSRHEACREEIDRALEDYRFADATQSAYRFFWSELCDWGLEAAKARLYEGSQDERRAAAGMLAWVLERSLRLLHPFMPFVTEEIWQRFDAGESIVIADWPGPNPEHRDASVEHDFGIVQGIVGAIRRWRKEHGIRDSKRLAGVLLHPLRPQREGETERYRHEIDRLANVVIQVIGSEPAESTGFVVLPTAGARVYLPVADFLDVRAERRRLDKRLAEIHAERAKADAKLANEGFVAKAPAAVIRRERDRVAALEEEAATLATQLDELA
jgi:valyl-tRNA synthetase